MTVLSDHPARGGADQPDHLQLESRLSAVFDILRHKQTRCPITIAIYGDWGTGKTSAMRWLETQLKAWNRGDAKQREHHPRVHPVWFDPWRYHSREEVWRGIIAEVILSLFSVDTLDRENLPTRLREAAKMFGAFLGRGFLHALANVEVNVGGKGLAEVKISGEAFRDIYEEYDRAAQPAKAHLNQFESTLRDWVGKFLKRGTDGVFTERLVIFIDDLDRCLPSVTLEVLEAIKLYLNIEPLVFVVGLDRTVVDGVVQKHYKESGVNEAKSREYLNKLFQIEIQIPHSETRMESYLERQIDAINQSTGGFWAKMLGDKDADNRRYLEAGIQILARDNPREIKRLLNSALLLGRGAADQEFAALSDGDRESARCLRFAQGVQLFLLHRLLQDRVSDSSKILLGESNLQWFERLSRFVCKVVPKNYQPTPEDFARFQRDATAKEPDATPRKGRAESVSLLNEGEWVELGGLFHSRPSNELGEALVPSFLAHPTLWTLLRVPFSAAVARFAPRAAVTVFGTPTIRLGGGASESELAAALGEMSGILRDAIASNLVIPVPELRPSDLLVVRELNFSYITIKDVDLIHLGKLTALQRLDLSGTQVTDASLQDTLGKLTALKSLDLSGTKVTDASLKDTLGKLTALQQLGLWGTQITDASLKDNLGKLSALQQLDLSRTKVGKRFVDEARRRYPNLKIQV